MTTTNAAARPNNPYPPQSTAPPTAVAVTNDRAVIAERDDARRVFGAYLVRMPELMHQRYALASPPTAVGVVEGAKRGDPRAFDALVRRYRVRVFALALHLSGSESDADDITQDVFIRAFHTLRDFEGRSEFFTWVYRLTVNRSIDARRARARRSESSIEEQDPRLERAVQVDSGGDPRRAAELQSALSRQQHSLRSSRRRLTRTPTSTQPGEMSCCIQNTHGERGIVFRIPRIPL